MESTRSMETPNWNKERDKLRARFTAGDITAATREDLERYLVVLANTMQFQGLPNPVEKIQHERDTEAFAIIIRHLLTIQLGQELLGKSHEIAKESNDIARESKEISRHAEFVSRVSAVAAIVLATLTGLAIYLEHRNTHPSKTYETPLPPPQPLLSDLQPTSSMKTLFPASNYASNAHLTIPPLATNSAASSQATPVTNR